jgi:hypothetical protein
VAVLAPVGFIAPALFMLFLISHASPHQLGYHELLI